MLRAWPAGCVVSGGHLQLPRSTVALLTGRGVHFRGTTFSGAALRLLIASSLPTPFVIDSCQHDMLAHAPYLCVLRIEALVDHSRSQAITGAYTVPASPVDWDDVLLLSTETVARSDEAHPPFKRASCYGDSR